MSRDAARGAAQDFGPSLAELAHLPSSSGEALELAIAAATALGELHDSGELHGAIRPELILFSTSGALRCSFAAGSPIAGDERFLAPELRLRPGCRPSADLDFFALGRSFLAALGGRDAALDRVMRKLSEDKASLRYRSVYGLLRDLEALHSKPATVREAFALGAEDRDPRAYLSPFFVGRAKEMEAFRALARKAIEGGGGIVFVSGAAGIGKTAFVREALGPNSGAGWIYVEGKSEAGSSRPYLALGQALRAYLRSKLLVGPGRPEPAGLERLALLLDEEPGMETSGGGNESFVNLLLRIARAEGGLVLFIDDLQWADRESVELCALAASFGSSPLCIAITYREGEVDWSGEPYSRMAVFRGSGASNELGLGPLSSRELESSIERSLPGLPSEELSSLSVELFGFSGGAPQYAASLLRALRESGELAFSSLRGSWSYRARRRPAGEYDQGAVALIFRGLSRLDAEDRAILFSAACFPSALPLELLAKSPSSRERAERLAAMGYFRPSDDRLLFGFSHDNVREAALGLFDESRRRETALGLARILSSSSPSSVFEIAELYLEAGSDAVPVAERLPCARACLEAARRSESALGFDAASRYADGGLSFLPEAAWEADYALCLDLHLVGLSSALKARRPERAGELARCIVEGAVEEDRLPALEAEAMLLVGEHRLGEAIEAFAAIIRGLGFRVYGKDAPLREAFRRFLNDARMRRYPGARGRRIADGREVAALRVCTESFTSAFVSAPDFCADLCNMAAAIVLRRAALPASPLMLSCFAQSECLRGGYGLGKRAAGIAARCATELEVASVPPFPLMLKFFTAHYWEPIREGMDAIAGCYEESMRVGSYEYAGVCANIYCFDLVFYGGALDSALPAIERCLAAIGAVHQERSVAALRRTLQLCLNLQGKSALDRPWRFEGPWFDAEVDGPRLDRARDSSARATLHLCSLLVAFLLGEGEAARSEAEALEPAVAVFRSQSLEGMALFYLALVLLAPDPAASEETMRERRSRAARLLTELKRRDRDPSSCYHYLYEALRARIAQARGRRRGVEEGYRRALEGARRAGCLMDRGCIAELLAALYRERGDESLEVAMLREAHACYAAWGAVIKTRALERERPWLSGLREGGPAPPPPSPEPNRFDSILPRLERVAIDTNFDTVAEVDLLALMDWTGAERCLLVREADGAIAAWADGSRAADGSVTFSIHGGDEPGIPARLILDAFSPYKGELRLETLRASLSGSGGAEDPESPEPESSLLLPLEFRGLRGGFLVLEHDSVAGLFVGGELGSIRLLALQALAALDQAALSKREASLRREREELLRAERLTALGLLGASVGHEVRAPVHAIRMNVSFLHARLSAAALEGCEDCASALRDIDEAAAQIGEIAAELAGFARERGDRESLDLGAVVEAALRLARDYIKGSSARLSFSPAEGGSPCRGSAPRLKQLAIILVENACQAMEPGGGALRVSVFPSGGFCVLEVEDEGRGIAPEGLRRATEAFYTTRAAEGGIGLGLSIASGIAKEHGGELEIASELGRGTTVRARIPRRPT